MMLIKAKFLKGDKPSGRAYTYSSNDWVSPGDIVVNVKGNKLVVVDEPVDMEWVQTYGKENLKEVVKKVEVDE